MTSIECIGLSENQVAHAVSMYADDNLKGNLYSLHAVSLEGDIKKNIISVDENIECDEMFLDDMTAFVKSLNSLEAERWRRWEVYAVIDEWSSRQTTSIEGLIAFAD